MNTGVGCHSILQGIFPMQGLNLGLLYCRQILNHLSHQGSPKSWTLLPWKPALEEDLEIIRPASLVLQTCHWKLGGDGPRVPLPLQERTVSSVASFLLISKLPTKLARTWAKRNIRPPALTWTLFCRESSRGEAAGSCM